MKPEVIHMAGRKIAENHAERGFAEVLSAKLRPYLKIEEAGSRALRSEICPAEGSIRNNDGTLQRKLIEELGGVFLGNGHKERRNLIIRRIRHEFLRCRKIQIHAERIRKLLRIERFHGKPGDAVVRTDREKEVCVVILRMGIQLVDHGGEQTAAPVFRGCHHFYLTGVRIKAVQTERGDNLVIFGAKEKKAFRNFLRPGKHIGIFRMADLTEPFQRFEFFARGGKFGAGFERIDGIGHRDSFLLPADFAF